MLYLPKVCTLLTLFKRITCIGNAASLEYISGWQQGIGAGHAQTSHLNLRCNTDMTWQKMLSKTLTLLNNITQNCGQKQSYWCSSYGDGSGVVGSDRLLCLSWQNCVVYATVQKQSSVLHMFEAQKVHENSLCISKIIPGQHVVKWIWKKEWWHKKNRWSIYN